MDPSPLHYHGRWQPRFGKSAKILGHCWAKNRTITQAMRLETHPEWITHPCHTYTRCLTTFICNGWAYGSITTSLSWQVLAQIWEISQFSLSGKNSLRLECNAQNTLSYIRQGGQRKNYITKQINKEYSPVCTQSGLFISDLSSYVGSENVSFQLLKVLAVGQTSIVACTLLCGQRPQTEGRRLSALLS